VVAEARNQAIGSDSAPRHLLDAEIRQLGKEPWVEGGGGRCVVVVLGSSRWCCSWWSRRHDSSASSCRRARQAAVLSLERKGASAPPSKQSSSSSSSSSKNSSDRSSTLLFGWMNTSIGGWDPILVGQHTYTHRTKESKCQMPNRKSKPDDESPRGEPTRAVTRFNRSTRIIDDVCLWSLHTRTRRSHAVSQLPPLT